MSVGEIKLLKSSFESLCKDTSNALAGRLNIKRQDSFSENFVILINNFNSYAEIADTSLNDCIESWNNQEEQKEVNKLTEIKSNLVSEIKEEIKKLCNEYDLKKLWNKVSQKELDAYKTKINSLNKEVKLSLKKINGFKDYLSSNKEVKEFWYKFDDNLVEEFYKIEIAKITQLKVDILEVIKGLIREKSESSILKLKKELASNVDFSDVVSGDIALWEQGYQAYEDEEYYNLVSDGSGIEEESYRLSKVDEEIGKKYKIAQTEFLELVSKNKKELVESIEKDFNALESNHTKKHESVLRELKNLNSIANALDSDTITKNVISEIPEVIFILKDDWDQLEDEHYQEYKRKFKDVFNLENEQGLVKFVANFEDGLYEYEAVKYQTDKFEEFRNNRIKPTQELVSEKLAKYSDTRYGGIAKVYNESIALFKSKEQSLTELTKNKYKIDNGEFEKQKEKIKKDATKEYIKKFKIGLTKYYTYALKKSFHIFDLDSLQFMGNMLGDGGGGNKHRTLALGSGEHQEEIYDEEEDNQDFGRRRDVGDKFYQMFASPEEARKQGEGSLALAGEKARLRFSDNVIEKIDELFEEDDFFEKASEDLNKNFGELFEYIATSLDSNISGYKEKIGYYKKYLEFLTNGQKELFNSLNYATNRKNTLDKLIAAFKSYLDEQTEVLKGVLFGSKEDVFKGCFEKSIIELNEMLSENQEKLDEKLVEAILKSSENVYKGQVEYFNNSTIASELRAIYQEYDKFLLKLQNAIKNKIIKLQVRVYNPVDKYTVIKDDWNIDINCTVIDGKVEVVSMGRLSEEFKNSSKAYMEFVPELESKYKYEEVNRLGVLLGDFQKDIKSFEGYLLNVKSEIEKYKETDSIVRFYYFLYAVWWHNKEDIKEFIENVKDKLNIGVVSKRLLDEKSLYTIIQKLGVEIDINQMNAHNLRSVANRNFEEFYEDIEKLRGIELGEGSNITKLRLLQEEVYKNYLTEPEYFSNYNQIIDNKKSKLKSDLSNKELNTWDAVAMPKIYDKYIKNTSLNIESSIKVELETTYENYERGCSEDSLLNKLLNYVSELKAKATAFEKSQLHKNTLLEFDKQREQCIGWYDDYKVVELSITSDNYNIEKFKESFENWSKGYKNPDIKVEIKNDLLIDNITSENAFLNQNLIQILNDKKQNITKLHQKFLTEFVVKQRSIKESFKITPISNILSDSKIIFNEVIGGLSKEEKLTLKWQGSLDLINAQVNNFADIIHRKCINSGEIILYKEYILTEAEVMLKQYINIFIKPSKDNLYNEFYDTIKKIYGYFEMLVIEFKDVCTLELKDIVGVFNLEEVPTWKHFIEAQGDTALDVFKESRELEFTVNEEEARVIVNHWLKYHKNKLGNDYLIVSKLFDKSWSDKIINGIVEIVINNNKDGDAVYELSKENKTKMLEDYLNKISLEINEYFNIIGVINE